MGTAKHRSSNPCCWRADLLLVGEADLDGCEGDVVALHQPLLAHSQEDRAVRVAVQTLGYEPRPHLVINSVLNLKKYLTG